MKRFIIFCVCFLFSIPNVFGEDVRLLIKLLDGKTETITAPLIQNGNVQFLKISKETLPPKIQYLEVHHPYATAKAGEDGFYVFCTGMYGTFKERPNGLYQNKDSVMPMFGVKTPRGAMTVILTGMRYEAHHLAEIKDGVYTVFPRFVLDGDVPYEDIAVEFHLLDKNKATYSDMAKVYRKYQLDEKVCVPLKERTKNNPVLDYAAQSMEIRVRMGWKPVPSPVAEQTAENEPPMKVAITFDRFKQIVDEFKRQGINKAEFCLVGWHIGGHDGRNPQIFPPDERLGGETKLREAIEKAQTEGFQIVCHTSHTWAYHASSIGGLWDEGYLLRKKDGKLDPYSYNTTWGGGRAYQACPKCMYERFVQSDFDKLKDFGFNGLLYSDIFSTVNPRTCYAPEHPLTKEDYATWTKKIFSDAQQKFGGLASEGGYDYCISNLDYALYLSFYNPEKPLPSLIERHVPFWQLVYSGIVLNTPYTNAVNYTIKSPLIQLKQIEFGGRPVFYFYSKFTDTTKHSAWMGTEDLTCNTDEELVQSVAKIKKGFDEFEKFKALQFETMESHDCIAENVFKTTFSDGTNIISNYSNSDFDYNGQTVKPMGYAVIRNQ